MTTKQPKLTAAQDEALRIIREAGTLESSSFAMTTTWHAGNKKISASTVEALRKREMIKYVRKAGYGWHVYEAV